MRYIATEPLIHYCLVRADLPIGTVAAQLIHAAGESSPGFLPANTIAVCLAVANEAELRAWEEKLIKAKIEHKAIREPDPPWNWSLMTIGVKPLPRSLIKPFFMDLKLYR